MIVQKKIYDPTQYYSLENALTKREVEYVIKSTVKLPAQEAETLGANDSRSSIVKWIPMEKDWAWLYRRMMELSIEANNIWDFDLKNLKETVPERIQYTEYHASESGHYDWHQDIGKGKLASRRKISITIQLSDGGDYKGGDLLISVGGSTEDGDFKHNKVCPRGLGTGVLFPSYMMHKVSPVTKGTRKSLVLWVGGEHYK